MPYQFTISPDLSTRYISGWYVFNTWLQRTLAQHIHLELYRDFDQCRRAIETDGVDLIFANPYDASLLVRDKGFLPVAHPRARPDEVIIAVQTDSPVRVIEDFRPGLRVATSTDPAVQIIGMIMLEAADLTPESVTVSEYENYVLVAKQLLRGDADTGFFMADSFNELSPLTRRSLRVVLQSQIHVIHHMLLAGPRMAAFVEPLRAALADIGTHEKGLAIQRDLGFAAWDRTEREDAEFMVDLMETLT